MKKIWILSVLIGILAFAVISIVTLFSEEINSVFKTFLYIIVGYIGVISFAYGWLKIFGKK